MSANTGVAPSPLSFAFHVCVFPLLNGCPFPRPSMEFRRSYRFNCAIPVSNAELRRLGAGPSVSTLIPTPGPISCGSISELFGPCAPRPGDILRFVPSTYHACQYSTPSQSLLYWYSPAREGLRPWCSNTSGLGRVIGLCESTSIGSIRSDCRLPLSSCKLETLGTQQQTQQQSEESSPLLVELVF